MLKIIAPYVVYGYPTLKTVKDLIYKRGFTKVTGTRQALTNNELIEQHLGQYDIICLEEIIDHIYNCGEHFIEVNKFLSPFHLAPAKTIEGTRVQLKETPKAGNLKEKINEFIESMN